MSAPQRRARARKSSDLIDAERGLAWAPASGRRRPLYRVALPVARDGLAHFEWDQGQRFSLHPLYELVAGDNLSDRTQELARLARVKPQTITTWWARGGVRWERADELAVAVGTHPGVIWPDWWQLA